MAFMKSNGVVVSFAKYQDLVDHDQRLQETNEGLTEEIITPLLKRATERILTKMRATDWWKSYYTQRSVNGYVADVDLPALDPSKIIDRLNDFTDLCIYTAMAEYILPKVADFGSEDNAEYRKMGYYKQRESDVFTELIRAGDFYDFDGSGSVSSTEKAKGYINLKRVR